MTSHVSPSQSRIAVSSSMSISPVVHLLTAIQNNSNVGVNFNQFGLKRNDTLTLKTGDKINVTSGLNYERFTVQTKSHNTWMTIEGSFTTENLFTLSQSDTIR